MKSFPRADRVSALIHRTISELLKKRIKDPRLDSVTITDVKMTSDLRIARIYFTVYGDQERRDSALNGFKSAEGFVKRTLGPLMGLRYMPDLQFYYDESFDYASRIETLLRSVHAGDGSDRLSSEE